VNFSSTNVWICEHKLCMHMQVYSQYPVLSFKHRSFSCKTNKESFGFKGHGINHEITTKKNYKQIFWRFLIHSSTHKLPQSCFGGFIFINHVLINLTRMTYMINDWWNFWVGSIQFYWIWLQVEFGCND